MGFGQSGTNSGDFIDYCYLIIGVGITVREVDKD